jgi:hypothetical protein
MSWKRPKRKEINIDEPNDNITIYKISNRQKATTRDFEQKKKIAERLNKIKKKQKRGYEDKRGVLIIKAYMGYLHSTHTGNIDVHHWMPKSRIRRNDFFVCCIDKDTHYSIHHGGWSVNGFIEDRGMDNLLMDSAILFAEWLATESAKEHRYYQHFVDMIKNIKVAPTNYEHVLNVTRECAENIRLSKEIGVKR